MKQGFKACILLLMATSTFDHIRHTTSRWCYLHYLRISYVLTLKNDKFLLQNILFYNIPFTLLSEPQRVVGPR